MTNRETKAEKIFFHNMKEQSYVLKESLRTLRTNIQFCGDDIHAILFTSAAPDEGKSTVAMELARSLTDAKKNVLFIDADIRRSVFVGRTGAHTESGAQIYGLSHYLSGQKKMSEVVYTTEIPRLYMVFSGPTVPNPTEILDKNYFENLVSFGKEYFDYVLIDCPPIGAAIDAAVIAKYCDGAILVTAQGQVSSRVIQSVKKQLEVSGVRILGAVLNKVNMKKTSYYGKYYSKYYGNYYGYYNRDTSDEMKK